MQSEEFLALLVQAERFLRIALTVLVTYLAALWIAAVWWTFQDIRSRTTDIFVRLAATLFVLAFNLPGLLIYVLLRPQRTLADLYAESLEEEALLHTIDEEGSQCPSCREPIGADFLYCPSCSARLRQRCPGCDRPVLLRWRVCPYCGRAPSAPPRAASPTPARSEPARSLETSAPPSRR